MDGRNSWRPVDPNLPEATEGRNARSCSHRPIGAGAADVGRMHWLGCRASSAALALAGQLRLVSTSLSVSDEELTAQKQHPYSEDLADLAGEVTADIVIGMATKAPKARPYNQAELPVLLRLYSVAQVQSDIITCFQLLSKPSRHAIGEHVRSMMSDIQRLRKGPA